MRALWLFSLLLLGCSCGDEDGGLRVEGVRGTEGERGYVRCFAAAAPEDRSWSRGQIRWTSEGRSLRMAAGAGPARLAAFTGPVSAEGWEAVRALRPHAAVIVGGAPREVPELPFLVLLLAGGDDEHPGYRAAADGEKVVDLSVYRELSLGPARLAVVAGAPGGGYVRSNDGCGFAEGDVDAWEDVEAVATLSWAGPTGVRGIDGMEAGSPLVARILESTGAPGVVFAWPREAAGRVDEGPLRVGLRPLAGPWPVRSDGARVPPAPTLLLVSEAGVEVASDSP